MSDQHCSFYSFTWKHLTVCVVTVYFPTHILQQAGSQHWQHKLMIKPNGKVSKVTRIKTNHMSECLSNSQALSLQVKPVSYTAGMRRMYVKLDSNSLNNYLVFIVIYVCFIVFSCPAVKSETACCLIFFAGAGHTQPDKEFSFTDTETWAVFHTVPPLSYTHSFAAKKNTAVCLHMHLILLHAFVVKGLFYCNKTLSVT